MMTNDDLCRSVYLLHLATGLQSQVKLVKLAGWSSRSITNSLKFRHPGRPLPNFAQNERVQEGLWSRGKTGSDAVTI